MNIEEIVDEYYSEIANDENARYKSWEHCHGYFMANRVKKDLESIELMSLHLGFYLASWGMYRGSSFLLQKDFLVHNKVIEILIEDKYNILWEASITELEDNIDLLMDVKKRIEGEYVISKSNVSNNKNITDTLLSKILMGTYACVPAYDEYFTKAIKTQIGANKKFNEKSVKQLIEFCEENKNEIDRIKEKLNKSCKGRISYTDMKIIDMYFWQLEYRELKKKR